MRPDQRPTASLKKTQPRISLMQKRTWLKAHEIGPASQKLISDRRDRDCFLPNVQNDVFVNSKIAFTETEKGNKGGKDRITSVVCTRYSYVISAECGMRVEKVFDMWFSTIYRYIVNFNVNR